MQATASIPMVLRFLSDEYETHKKKSIQEQKQIQKTNESVQTKFKSRKSLRDLYVDLMMYDTLVDHVRRVKGGDVDQMYNTFITNKSIVTKKIKERELQGEFLVPDKHVELIKIRCLENAKDIIPSLLPWVTHKTEFIEQVAPILHKKDWPTRIVKIYINDQKSCTPTVQEFRNCTLLIECLNSIQEHLDDKS